MKLGVISDIHGDLESLQMGLRRLEGLKVDAIVCAGDVVASGALFAEATVRLVRECQMSCVRGNHDRWSARAPQDDASVEPYDALALDLSSESLAWLSSLPTFWRASFEGIRLYMTHGTPDSDLGSIEGDTPEVEVQRHLEVAAADVMLVGHTHRPLCRRIGKRMVCNPGAVLKGKLEAAAVYDKATGEFETQAAASTGTFGVLTLPEMTFEVYGLDGSKVDV